MPRLTITERLFKNEEKLKKLSEQRKQILNELKEEKEQICKNIGAKIMQAIETNEQFKVDFINLIKEHNINIELLDVDKK